MNNLKRLPEGAKVVIPCVYNSGRRAYVRATVGHPEVIHIQILDDPERPYQGVVDRYLHLCIGEIENKVICEYKGVLGEIERREAKNIIEAVKGINKYFFAGQLTVLSDYPTKMIVERVINGENYEVVVPLSEAHLGGSWQHYYQDRSWMKDAQGIKDDTIYYA